MTLGQSRISSSELGYLIFSFTLGSSMLFPPARIAGNDDWAADIVGLGEALIVIFLYVLLFRRSQGADLIQVHREVYGNKLSVLASSLFLIYTVHLTSLVLSSLSSFVWTVVLPETPRVVIDIAFIVVCSFAASSGIEVLARCSQVLTILTVFSVLSATAMLIPKWDLAGLLPILEIPLDTFLWSIHSAAIFPFTQSVVFLLVLSSVTSRRSIRSLYSVLALPVLLAGLVLTLIAIRNIGVLGHVFTISIHPSYQAVRLIELADTIERIEILVALNFLYMVFIKISVLQYASALGISKLLHLRSYRPLIWPLGALVTALEQLNYISVAEYSDFLDYGYPLYASFFHIALPVVTLIVATLRRTANR